MPTKPNITKNQISDKNVNARRFIIWHWRLLIQEENNQNRHFNKKQLTNRKKNPQKKKKNQTKKKQQKTKQNKKTNK